jgi:ABC-type transporter Mla subunit MlaD
MAPSREADYYKIGLFVIIGLVLIISGIIFLGSGRLFEKKIHIETYFNESVQGLAVGSAVKYQGVEIGSIEKMTFIASEYHNSFDADLHNGSYIYVEMAVSPNFLNSKQQKDIKNSLADAVQQGLRVKISLQGLTGNNYLELNFIDPQKNPPPKIYWTPKKYYIPSTKSTLSRFSNNAQYILDELKKIDFNKFFQDATKLIDSADNLTGRLDNLVAHSNKQYRAVADNLEIVAQNLREFSSDITAHPSQLIFGKPPAPLDPGSL